MGKKQDVRQDRYFQIHHYMLKTDAWQALSAPARAVYLQIGSRYMGTNNGKIPYSVREAASECRLNKTTAARAFKELIEFGFIEETRHGSLSRKTRIASEWRLTAFRCDLTGTPKSVLFMQRGAQARASRQPRSRPQEPVRLSKTRASRTAEPVPNEGRDCPKRGYSLSQTRASQSRECPKRGPVEPVLGGSPVPNEGTLLIYHPQSDSETTLAGQLSAPDRPSWTTPVVRELFGAEADFRRAECGVSEWVH